MEEKNDIVIYQLEDGKTKIDVKLEDETVWLSQQQMAALYDTTKQNISLHIKNIFDEEELIENSTVKEFFTVQKEGNRSVERKVKYYNLDMIISLGYRIKSKVATNFRRWATERLKEYMIKGFTMDDERLKGNGEENRNAKYRCYVTSMMPNGDYYQEIGESEGTITNDIICELKKPYFYSVFILNDTNVAFNELKEELNNTYRYNAIRKSLKRHSIVF